MSDSMSVDEYKKHIGKTDKKTENKFGAVRMTTGGKTYDSTKEGKYSQVLDLRKKLPVGDTDRVIEYQTQVRYSLDVAGLHICFYDADFVVEYENRIEVVDVKGYKKGTVYKMFQLKQRLMLACHKINVIEK